MRTDLVVRKTLLAPVKLKCIVRYLKPDCRVYIYICVPTANLIGVTELHTKIGDITDNNKKKINDQQFLINRRLTIISIFVYIYVFK